MTAARRMRSRSLLKVEDLLRANCVVAIGVSGGKDSVACALAWELAETSQRQHGLSERSAYCTSVADPIMHSRWADAG